jgi:plastocyanin
MRVFPTATESLVALLAAALLTAGGAHAAEIRVTVKKPSGEPVADAVVVAVPIGGAPRAVAPRENEIMDQIDHEFVPHVKPILVGASVFFPNKDNVRHQVYSFSPAKVFELPLYAGTPSKPIVFDKPGVVVLGCNIHDWMVGYIYVSQSPWFAKTAVNGTVVLRDLPPQRYTVRVWHPEMEGIENLTQKTADLSAIGSLDMSWDIKLRPDIRIRRAPAAGSYRHY